MSLLHAFTAAVPIDPSKRFTYWTIHGETMTPVRISVGYGGKVTLDIVPHPAGETPFFASHPQAQDTPATLVPEIMAALQAANPKLRHKTTRLMSRKDVTLPDYLIVFDINGGHPAIARTVEPQFVLPIDEAAHTLATEYPYFRVIQDLPAKGWTYWWTDAYRAYQELAPALIASASASASASNL